MKILLDENIDINFKFHLKEQGLDVFTVKDMCWTGIKNDDLLDLIQEHHFDCWIVVDKNIPYQQNLSNITCIIIVLDVYRNTIRHLIPFVDRIVNALNQPRDKNIIIMKEV